MFSMKCYPEMFSSPSPSWKKKKKLDNICQHSVQYMSPSTKTLPLPGSSAGSEELKTGLQDFDRAHYPFLETLLL